MTLQKMMIAMTLLVFSFSAHAEVKYLVDSLRKATPEEVKNFKQTVKKIKLAPTKEKIQGKPVFVVEKVEKGSVYERAGLQVGDKVINASSTAKAPTIIDPAGKIQK